jgi:hypothetical protein
MKNAILTICCFGFLLTGYTVAQEDPQVQINEDRRREVMQLLRTTVTEYLTSIKSKNGNYWNKRIAQKVADSDSLSDIAALNALTLDWFNDNKKALEDQSKFDPKTLEMGCQLIKCIFDHDSDFPSEIAKEFVPKDIEDFCQFLKDQIKKQK